MSFVTEISVGTKDKLSDEAKKKASDMIESARKIDSKLVKGIFKNLESKGGDLTFAYRQYRGEPTRVYHMLDAQEYEIPLGVAKHINRQCKYKKSKFLMDKDGNRIIGADTPEERYKFISTDFM